MYITITLKLICYLGLFQIFRRFFVDFRPMKFQFHQLKSGINRIDIVLFRRIRSRWHFHEWYPKCGFGICIWSSIRYKRSRIFTFKTRDKNNVRTHDVRLYILFSYKYFAVIPAQTILVPLFSIGQGLSKN